MEWKKKAKKIQYVFFQGDWRSFGLGKRKKEAVLRAAQSEQQLHQQHHHHHHHRRQQQQPSSGTCDCNNNNTNNGNGKNYFRSSSTGHSGRRVGKCAGGCSGSGSGSGSSVSGSITGEHCTCIKVSGGGAFVSNVGQQQQQQQQRDDVQHSYDNNSVHMTHAYRNEREEEYNNNNNNKAEENANASDHSKAMASLNLITDDAKTRNNNNNNTNHNNNNNSNSKEDLLITHKSNKNVIGSANVSNSNTNTIKSTTSTLKDHEELKALEERKFNLEQLLNEKNFLLQQIKLQETQILNGNAEIANVNEWLSHLQQQYRSEYSDDIDMSILRRKNTLATATAYNINNGGSGGGGGGMGKENQPNNGNNSNSNNNMHHINNHRQSLEISNRSSEYDNMPSNSLDGDSNSLLSANGAVGVTAAAAAAAKNALKKRTTPTPISHLNYIQVQHMPQRPQPQYQHPTTQQQQHQQQQYKFITPPHVHYQQQQQQQQQLQQQQQARAYHQRPPPDTISLYSMNSTNVATLRQQHVAPQQPQPIIVQCDKYYLSPTHQIYDAGGFIKSSQNIKRYNSPMASPTTPTSHNTTTALATPLTPLQQQQDQLQMYVLQQHATMQQLPPHLRQLDAISLAPSYISVDGELASAQNVRWRSQTHLPPPPATVQLQQQQQQQQQQQHQLLSTTATLMSPQPAHLSPTSHSLHAYTVSGVSGGGIGADGHDLKSLSSDMLAHYYTAVPTQVAIHQQQQQQQQQQKKSKPKQWLESSLDGPVIRTPFDALSLNSNAATTPTTPTHTHTHLPAATIATATTTTTTRERSKLSSQSMSSGGRHYSMSSHKTTTTIQQQQQQQQQQTHFHFTPTQMQQQQQHQQQLQHNHHHPHDDEGRRYAKLSQSTSQLNVLEAEFNAAFNDAFNNSAHVLDMTPLELPNFKYLPPKPNALMSGGTNGGGGAAIPPPPPRPPPPPVNAVTAQAIAVPAPPPPLPAPLTTPLTPIATATTNTSTTDIRIESPKNMTIVQPATFQPYKEVTKPFEMSDFYKYSTKFRQKENTNSNNNIDATVN